MRELSELVAQLDFAEKVSTEAHLPATDTHSGGLV